MNQTEKEKLITEVVALLQARLNAMTTAPTAEVAPQKSTPEAVEMLTIKECSECVRGLSVHTVRQLVAQGKIPSIRTGQGKGGKILVSKSALLAYFEGGAA